MEPWLWIVRLSGIHGSCYRLRRLFSGFRGLLFAINATATAAMGASAAPNPERNSPMALSSSAIYSMFTSFPWLTYL